MTWNAGLLIFVIYGITALYKSAVPIHPKIPTALVPLAASFLGVFLVANSDAFAHTQLVNKVALDNMNWQSLAVVAIAAAAGAAGLDQIVRKGIANIGQNQE